MSTHGVTLNHVQAQRLTLKPGNWREKRYQAFHPATYLLGQYGKDLLEINQMKKYMEKRSSCLPQEISEQHLLISECLSHPLHQLLEIW